MILYFIQLSTIWTLLLIAFYVFYKNQSYHQFNRWYILLSLIVGIILPTIPVGVVHHDVSILTASYQMITMFTVINSEVASAGNNFSYYLIAFTWIVYISLVIVKLYQTYIELSIYLKVTKHKKLITGNVFIKYTDIFDQPFSFLNTMVLPKVLEQDSKNKAIVIAHECTHIRLKHHYDLIFLKILEILFPYHPCVHFFKKELILIHEFQADKEAVLQSNEEEYTQVLIQFAQKAHLRGSMIHTFYFSPIKTRIMMLFKQTSKLQYFFLVFIPVLFSACIYLNQDFEIGFPVTLPNIIKNDTTITHSDLTMGYNNFLLPFFPEGDKGLMEFLGKNIKYPESGGKKGIQGTSYVKFEVDEDGSIHNKKILRSLGEEFDKELYRVVDLMPNWLPPTKDGKKVKTTYTLPVKFKLAD